MRLAWGHSPYWIVLLVFVGSAWLSVSAQTQLSISNVKWLHGCWTGTRGQLIVDEQWMAPRGNSMLGMSRTVRSGQTTSFEVVHIKEQDGGLAYEAHPSNQPMAVFLGRQLADETIAFENPQHDFPQRIGYRRTGADALAAWIEGTDKGQTRRVDYAYRRVACD